MGWILGVRERLTAIFQKSKVERELDEELRFHIEQATEKNIRAGMSPDEARTAALRSFGGVERFKEEVRYERGVRPLEDLAQDIRYAVRRLIKSPGFTLAAVITLALGIGATTTIFALINGLFLRPLPGLEEPGRLVTVHSEVSSYLNYQDLREWNTVLADLAAFGDHLMGVRTDGEAERVLGMVVSANYFAVLGTRPARGRFFLPEEQERGAEHVAVISHALWQRGFGADARAIGSTIHVNGHPFTLVGVAPRRFLGTFVGFPVDVWVPFSAAEVAAPTLDLESRSFDGFELVGRLGDEVSLEQAQTGLSAVARRLEQAYPAANEGYRIDVRGHTGFDEELRTPAIALTAVLLSIALLVLLIACFNMANMLLVRSVARAKEIAIRQALGSGRLRIVRSLLTESLLLSFVGGSLGLFLAGWLGGALESFGRSFPIRLAFDFGLDLRVVFFAVIASGLTGLTFGIIPAVQSSKPDLVRALKDVGEKGSRRSRLRALFVTAQVAGSAILLVTGGLFLRTLANASETSPGFELDDVYVAPFLDLSFVRIEERRAGAFYAELIRRVESLPGFEAASAVADVPLAFAGSSQTEISVRGHQPPPDRDGFEVDFTIATPGYFETMRIPLTRGRDFDDRDTGDSPSVAIINETMARSYWADTDPIGRDFEHGGAALQIVGVVADTKNRIPSEAPRAFFYVPHAQQPIQRLSLLVRSRAGLPALAASFRDELGAFEPDLPRVELQPLRQFLAITLLPQRLAATVGGVLGLLGLILATIGIYTVVAFSVSQRTRELGIRMAVGGGRGDVVGLVIGEGLRLAGVGAVIGLLITLGLTRFLRGMLFGVSSADPLTYASVALLLTWVAALGSFLPARRASRVDPAAALRHE